MIYLDNAATSFPKPKRVVNEVMRCITKYCGNPGRSSHRLSVAAAEKIFDTRECVARLLGVSDPEQVCFTGNATHALNIAIKGLVNHKCHCIISDLEHNSVLRPLAKLEKIYGVTYSVYDSDLPLTEAIKPLIRQDTEFIITSIASNVTGKTLDVAQLSAIAEEHNLKLIIDGSQYIGHAPVCLSGLKCDAFCAPGHKALFGIQGSGFAVFGKGITANTLMEGGSGADTLNPEMPIFLPERHEAGTQATPAIASLYAGIDFYCEFGADATKSKIDMLTEQLKERLKTLPHTVIYGAENGIVSFNFKDVASSALAGALNEHGICVRGGLHCAPLIHKKLGTSRVGAVRVSLSVMNSKKDIDRFYTTLKSIIE